MSRLDVGTWSLQVGDTIYIVDRSLGILIAVAVAVTVFVATIAAVVLVARKRDS